MGGEFDPPRTRGRDPSLPRDRRAADMVKKSSPTQTPVFAEPDVDGPLTQAEAETGIADSAMFVPGFELPPRHRPLSPEEAADGGPSLSPAELVLIDRLAMNERLGKRIFAYRRRHGLSVAVFAARVGVTAKTIVRIETCEAWVRRETLRRLEAVIGPECAELSPEVRAQQAEAMQGFGTIDFVDGWTDKAVRQGRRGARVATTIIASPQPAPTSGSDDEDRSRFPSRHTHRIRLTNLAENHLYNLALRTGRSVDDLLSEAVGDIYERVLAPEVHAACAELATMAGRHPKARGPRRGRRA